MDFYDDHYDYDPYDNDDLKEWGDREAWEDAQGEMRDDLPFDSYEEDEEPPFDPYEGFYEE